MVKDSSHVVRFDEFELDLRRGELRRRGLPIALKPQQFTLLSELASAPGALVSREQLRQRLWGDDAFVDFDAGLNFCIRQLRLALGDSATQPRYIETVPRRGYRFIAATVSPDVSTPPPAAAAAAPPRARRLGFPQVAAWAIVVAATALGSFVGGSAFSGTVSAEARIADAHAAQGFIALNDDWSWTAAARSFSRALQLDQTHEVSLISMSRLHAAHGQFAASLDFARRAVEARPSSARARTTLGWALLYSGDPAAARRECTEAMSLRPTSDSARLCRLNAEAELGILRVGAWANLLANVGDTEMAPFTRATIAARAGHRGRALDDLRRALDRRDPEAVFARVHPAFATLRGEAEFARMTAAAGLPAAP